MTSTPKETTTKVEPWDGAKPYLLENYKDFADLLDKGAPQAWQGPTVAGRSKDTLQAQQMVENIARDPSNASVLQNAVGGVNSVLNSGLNAQAAGTLSAVQNSTNPTDAIAAMIASGQSGRAPGQYNQNYSNPALSQASGYGNYTNAASGLQSAQAQQLANGSNPAASAYLQQTASGANVGANPYLQANIAAQQASIADQLKNITNPGIDSQAAALGRTGSAAYASQRNNADATASRAMSDVAVNALTNQYNQDVAQQQSAAQLYGNLYNQDVSNRMSANQALASTDAQQQQLRQAGTSLYGNLADAQQTQRLNAANGANAQFNADKSYQLQGANLLSSNYNQNISNMLSAANSQLSADSALNGQKLNAASMAGQTYQNLYNPAQALAGVGQQKDAYSAAQLQSRVDAWNTAQQQPLQNIANFTNLLNGGGYSSTTQPVYGNQAGQVLGGLSSILGLFALCDIREKVLHSFLGYMPLLNGDMIAMYEFSYIGSDERFVGPVAQEVERKTGAVIEFAGRKVVDVSALMEIAA